MIPSNITREHIIQAIREIQIGQIPARRESTRWNISYEGKLYPPKYTVSLANRFANGIALSHQEFSGGSETNSFLQERGFEIVEKMNRIQVVKIVTHDKFPERAAECQEAASWWRAGVS